MEGNKRKFKDQRKTSTYTLDMVLKNAGYGFAMLDIFSRYDRQVTNLISVVGYKVLE